MSTAFIALAIAAFVLVTLCSIRAGGFWRFAKRACATLSAWCYALSGFCGLMDHASSVFIGHGLEALKTLVRDAGENRVAALKEMGERA